MKRMISLAAAFLVSALAACSPRTDVDARVTPKLGPSPATAPGAQAQLEKPPAAPPQTASAPPSASVSPEAFSDTVISARIKSALLSDPGMTGSDVSVNTDRGVVSLTGPIKSQEQAAIASAHAQRQDGVMRVDNHLTVSPT